MDRIQTGSLTKKAEVSPKPVLNSSHQLQHEHRGVCVTSHTRAERHLHACPPVDRGEAGTNACVQVRTRDSDFDRKRPRVSDGCVFMDAGIRRAAAERRACDKSGMKLSMTSVRLQLMNV